ncbi:MAG: type II toxin-antitoxin system VapC family toxin [Planctomycetaceae bacterium]
MIVLDTDHLSCLEWGSEESASLRIRLNESSDRKIVASIISYEEQTRGWMALIAKTPDIHRQVDAYSRLRKHLQLYCSVPLLDFSEIAARKFNELRQQKIRIGTMDLKIAASCLCENAVLLTRNTVDFSRIPGLKFEDWTQ